MLSGAKKTSTHVVRGTGGGEEGGGDGCWRRVEEKGKEGGEGEEEEASMTVGEGLAMSTRLSKEHRITREKGS